MSLFRTLISFATVMTIAASATLSADTAVARKSRESFHRETRQRDFDAVQRFVNSKRTIPLEEKDSNLSIAGDVRFGWGSVNEKVANIKQRGRDFDQVRAQEDEITNAVTDSALRTGVPFSNNVFEVEFNLYIDYVCDRTWAVAWLEFDNDAGIEFNWKRADQDPNGIFGSGSTDAICLQKAYIGYNIFSDGCNRLDVELGRRPLYTVFDSRVQFNNRFDGLLFKYATTAECLGNFYWNLGAFVVDERSDHYAWVTEMGLLNIANYGFDLKYSFTDWKTFAAHHNTRAKEVPGNVKDPAGICFQVSQISAYYHLEPEYLCLPVKFYGAFLHNHAARRFIPTNNSTGLPVATNAPAKTEVGRANNAWYAGVMVGQVCQERDWSIELNYQYVETQAVPDSDVSGIGSARNVLRDTVTGNGYGYTNYKGWFLEGVYAVTDNLSVDARFEWSKDIDANNGSPDNSKHKYSLVRLEAIYAF